MCIENIACLRFVAFREEIAHSELVSVACFRGLLAL